MGRTFYIAGLSVEAFVGLVAIVCTFLVPEVRRFIGLERAPVVEAAVVEPAPVYPATRRLAKPQKLEAGKPVELFSNFFVTYQPKPARPVDRGILWVAEGNWGEIHFNAEGRAGESTRMVWPDTVVRHQGEYQETLFVVTEITPTYIVIR